MGFAPNKSAARKTWFAAEKNNSATLVYYESTRRLLESLKDAQSTLTERNVVVCREISKKFEEVVRGNFSAVIDHYETSGAPKGEAVVIIGPAEKTNDANDTNISAENMLHAALKHMSVKSAAAFVAEFTGEKKNALYKQALIISGKADA